jgi:translation elongation factor EF-G
MATMTKISAAAGLENVRNIGIMAHIDDDRTHPLLHRPHSQDG